MSELAYQNSVMFSACPPKRFSSWPGWNDLMRSFANIELCMLSLRFTFFSRKGDASAYRKRSPAPAFKIEMWN